MSDRAGVRRPTRREAAEFDAAWQSSFGGRPPYAHWLPSYHYERWLRLHSLPESKQYPDTEAEYEVLLDRYFAEIDELHGDDEWLWVVTFSSSFTRRPVRRRAALVDLMPRPRLWRTIIEEDCEEDEEDLIWTHLYLNQVHRDADELRQLLRLVADAGVPVIVTGSDVTWADCPYDGGADLILPTVAERDRIADRFKQWLPVF
ncbi:hypothetical protein TPB0596_05630 [Tsukamurella pulmonis]|uniref:DUF3885 domain-containing protein n=1 Tax=Tsukamurella pulmonis TaxID=47312 RepID=UPI001EDD5D64|nr:hypothetical protein [Tsukamurella pulmonis]BDD80800.1 hypothetical protein TPB0596_05630 [Tsukamurella pulmonis]